MGSDAAGCSHTNVSAGDDVEHHRPHHGRHLRLRMPRISTVSVVTISLLVALVALPLIEGKHVANATHNKCFGETAADNCEDGMVFPLWRPFDNISTSDRVGRAIIYFLAVCYMFLGISIVSDRFMASIEVITSKERNVTVTKPDGEVVTFTVHIWNETVSNLTLMALGSSAPEIMLSVMGKNFEAGDLGPNTIVGSAAFNLFMIMAICVWVIPEGQVRRQKHLDVFFVTATWSVFAYAWLYLIIAVVTPGRVDIWEGVVTFLFFPLTVGTAYVADQKILVHRFLPRKYRLGSQGMIAVEGDDVEMALTEDRKGGHIALGDDANHELLQFEKHRKEFIELMKEIHRKYPQIQPDKLQQMAETEMVNRGPKSRAFYRVQATRRLTGGGDVVRRKIEKEHYKSTEAMNAAEEAKRANTCKIFFDPGHYTVLENVGTFNVVVTRDGGPPGLTVLVDYRTEDGSATAGTDFVSMNGTLTFYPGDIHQQIPIEIIDDDVFEEDEHFYVFLENLRVRTKDGVVYDPSKLGGIPVAEIDHPSNATVMILDDDHAGVFGMENEEVDVVETNGHLRLKVARHSGARGKIQIPYKTFLGTAKPDEDYEEMEGVLEFNNNETEKYIEVGIVDKGEYERHAHFFVEIYDPIWVKKLGDETKTQERFMRRQERKASCVDGEISEAGSRRGSVLDAGKKAAYRLSDMFRHRGSDPNCLSPTSQLSVKTIDEKEGAEGTGDDDGLLPQQAEIAELGKPRLGDITRVKVNIVESKEFATLVDTMMKNAKTGLMLSTSSWYEQFVEALTVSAGDDDDEEDDEEGEEGEDGEDKEPKQPTCGDYLMHFICVPWKLAFAFVPPTDYLSGWACFIISMAFIGVCTALTGDLASHFGCTIGLKDSVTAISFVALGTSVPDTFASKVSAIQDPYADNAVGNVTGSNAVNVFLGIGIAWTMAAVYHWFQGTPGGFQVEPGTLGFSLTIFTIEAFVCIFVLVIRRLPAVGGELGGPMKYKLPTTILFCMLWAIYVGISSLEAYCVIEGF